jgi:subtilisin family serine protease
MDHARATVRLDEHKSFVSGRGVAGTGSGVAIGVIDSGVDVGHPDLRNADGTTRVAWLLEFGAGPYGFFPELERALGCGSKLLRCGVLSAVQIDSLLTSDGLRTPSGVRVRVPKDMLGHGTHVASIAAGNGASNPRYAGVAPEATLIIAQVAQTNASVSDADVLVAARFVFDRAKELAMPVVVNMSLGGDFGPHDGASAAGLALVDMLDEENAGLGRAIVVAAGNSATLSPSSDPAYPSPRGIHTNVHIPMGTSQRVPILIPSGKGVQFGSVFVWLSFKEGDSVRVGVEVDGGVVALAPVPRGQAQSVSNEKLTVSVLNGLEASLGIGEVRDYAAAVVIDGSFDLGSVFALRLEGEGEAKLWLQSEGVFGGSSGTSGVLFSGATRSGTINIPADTEELIAVGATLNRLTWRGREGETVEVNLGTPDFDSQLNSLAFFSAAGPNGLGGIKPDLVAPGLAVVGAMAGAADPAGLNANSVFGFSALCEDFGCAVVDDRHGVALGTSMAAPMVTGAAALLLEQEPHLTAKELRRLLQAGASDVDLGGAAAGLLSTRTQAGAGVLNIAKSARALAARQSETKLPEPSATRSRVTLAEEFLRPSSKARVSGLLQLRDAGDELADATVEDLQLQVKNGRTLEPLRRAAPGLFEFAVAAENGKGGERLQVNVLYRGVQLRSVSLPIAVDHGVFAGGLVLRGGCAVSEPRAIRGIGAGYGALGWLLGVFSWVIYRVYPWGSQGSKSGS